MLFSSYKEESYNVIINQFFIFDLKQYQAIFYFFLSFFLWTRFHLCVCLCVCVCVQHLLLMLSISQTLIQS